MPEHSARGHDRTRPSYIFNPASRPFHPPCRFCGKANHRNSPSCGRRTCPGYVDTWLGDNEQRLFCNLKQWDGDVVMTTLTGPGKAELPWDEEHCAHRGPHRHRGPDGCRVLPLIAQQWNATAAARLSQLHKAAHQRTYRKYGKWSGRLAYGPEVHARGVVHWHIVVAFGTPFERRTGRFYIAQLHDRAATYDYGYVDRKVGRAAAGIAAASYISKYLTGDKGPKGLRALVLSGQAPERAVGVHRALTTCTRVTMRNLRLRRACWMLFRVRLDCSEAETIWAICRAFPGTELILPASDPSAEP